MIQPIWPILRWYDLYIQEQSLYNIEFGDVPIQKTHKGIFSTRKVKKYLIVRSNNHNNIGSIGRKAFFLPISVESEKNKEKTKRGEKFKLCITGVEYKTVDVGEEIGRWAGLS